MLCKGAFKGRKLLEIISKVQVEAVKALLAVGADPTMKNGDARASRKRERDGKTPLHAACEVESTRNEMVNLRDLGEPVFDQESDRVKAIRVLLEAEAEKNNLNQQDLWKTLSQAACFGGGEVVNALLNADANLKQQCNKSEYIDLLCDAAQYNNVEAVNLLLKAGVDPWQQVEHTIAPLLLAAFYGSVGVVKVLLKRSDSNNLDAIKTALSSAEQNGKSETAKLLREAINALTGNGEKH